jgi:hypothetical protein
MVARPTKHKIKLRVNTSPNRTSVWVLYDRPNTMITRTRYRGRTQKQESKGESERERKERGLSGEPFQQS